MMYIVIPCFNEPQLIDCLNSLSACQPPKCIVNVLVVINYPDSCDSQIKQNCLLNLYECRQISQQLDRHNFKISSLYLPEVPQKIAGVGYARQQGMDFAAQQLIKAQQPKGLIVAFDADSTCSSNYLLAIEQGFENKKDAVAASIYFEHSIEGDVHDSLIYKGIVDYELHLRYYKQALAWLGLPFAYHTVGSSMACTAEAYQKVGGMNRRKAGEDFYFLQKLIALGGFIEINTCTVYPSPRVSDRVPFGTGRAMLKYLEDHHLLTYQWASFVMLKAFIDQVDQLFRSTTDQQLGIFTSLDPALQACIDIDEWRCKIEEINKNSKTLDSFKKRFYTWFNAFMCLKILNEMHRLNLVKEPVNKAATQLLNAIGKPINGSLLNTYRALDRGD